MMKGLAVKSTIRRAKDADSDILCRALNERANAKSIEAAVVACNIAKLSIWQLEQVSLMK